MKIEASQAGKKGTIRIVDMISMSTNSSAERIRAIVDDFINNGIESADVYINSRGGSTIEAVEIANELDRLPEVIITVGAVAASAATYLMAKFKSRAYSNSQFMIHRPKGNLSGDLPSIQADLKLLENTTQDYKDAYALKMKKTPEEIEAYFAKGDYWMTAKEAKSIGLLDEIIASKEQITAEDVDLLTAYGAPIIPKVKANTNTEMDKNAIIAALGLPADATDAQIVAAAQKAKSDADTAATLKADAEKSKKDQVEAVVNQAITDKKITADQKDNYMSLGVADPDKIKAVLEALPPVQKPEIDPTASAGAKGRDKWTMEDYQDKDPEALAEMMTKDPEAFKKLEDDYFGKK